MSTVSSMSPAVLARWLWHVTQIYQKKRTLLWPPPPLAGALRAARAAAPASCSRAA